MARKITLKDNLTDESLYPQTVTAAVADANGNTLDDFAVESGFGKNLATVINQKAVTDAVLRNTLFCIQGSGIHQDGSIISSSNTMVRTPYIPVTPGETVSVGGYSGGQQYDYSLLCFYKEDKTFLSSHGNSGETGGYVTLETTVPANAAYMIVETRMPSESNNVWENSFIDCNFNSMLLNKLSLLEMKTDFITKDALSRYGVDFGVTPSYTTFGTEYTLGAEGDSIEIRMHYYGDTETYYDKLYILNGPRQFVAGFYKMSEFRVRPNTTIGWLVFDISTIDIKELHTYKIVRRATGYELLVDGVSKGVAECDVSSAVCSAIGGYSQSAARFAPVVDIDYVTFSITGSTFTYKDFWTNPNSSNVYPVVMQRSEDHTDNDYPNFVSYDKDENTFISYTRIPNTLYYVGITITINSSRDTIDDEIAYRYFWEIVHTNSCIYTYYPASNSMVKGLSTLQAGESEWVMHIDDANYNATDFTGGVHGDESIDILDSSYCKFFVDGVELSASDLSSSFDLRPCNQFSYIQRSALHKTARTESNYKTIVPTSSGSGVLTLNSSYHYVIDGVDTGLVAYAQNTVFTTIAAAIAADNLTLGQQDGYWTLSTVRIVDAQHTVMAEHIKETIFKDGGYVTKNTLLYTQAGSALSYYFFTGIICAHKNAAQIGYNENYEFHTFTGDSGRYLSSSGANTIKMYNTATGMSTEVSSRLLSGSSINDAQSLCYIVDRPNDSKYYRKTPTFHPAANTPIVSEASIYWRKQLS